MDYKKYGMGAEMNPMEALRLADEARRFARQGVEMPSDMTARMAKYGMSDTQIKQPGGESMNMSQMMQKQPGGESMYTTELPEATVTASKGRRKRGM